MKRGTAVVMEGIDGAGTETQSKLLLDYLKNKGIPAERIYYPDYTGPIGEALHNYLHKGFNLSVNTQFLLFAGDMVKDVEKIKKWTEEGKTVILDRYFTSTLAYQCLRGFSLDKALKFAEIFGIPKPDIIIYLKVSPETSMKRKFKEKNNLDRNEENKAFLEKVSKSYENLIEKDTFGKWFVIDGEKNKEEIFSEIKNILKI